MIEIANNLRNKEVIKSDLKEALTLVTSLFQDKYLTKLQQDLKQRTDETKKNPTKEIKLMQSIKPFLHIDQHTNLEKMIDALFIVQTLQNVNKDVNTLHNDGVYEIDSTCMSRNKSKIWGTLIAVMFLASLT